MQRILLLLSQLNRFPLRGLFGTNQQAGSVQWHSNLFNMPKVIHLEGIKENMLKAGVVSFILLISFMTLFPCSNIFAGKNLTEQEALDILVDQIKKDKLYDSWSSLSSLVFITENISEENIDFAIHEKHDEKSIADPYTSPVVDRFRIDRITKEIKWYDVLEAGFVPYVNILKTKNIERH